MISSMTAFGRSERLYAWGSANWEIKSVNHRYLEPTFKLPENLRQLEPHLRAPLKQQLNRGKIDCSLRITRRDNGPTALTINTDTLSTLLKTCRTIEQSADHCSSLNPLEVLAWPGVLDQQHDDDTKLYDDIIQQFEQTLLELKVSRQREGAQLSSCIAQRLQASTTLLSEVRLALPAILQSQQHRLRQKLHEITNDLDHQRLEQELVYAVQKADIEEELDRLDTHLQEIDRILQAGGTCGRRLDFLMQELNREANTVCAKSISSTTTMSAVELKVLIEQMREQIQNIE